MPDDATTIADLKAAVAEFVDAREWRPFHNPKNLAMAMAIEVGELMEHFQWLDLPDSAGVAQDAATMQQIREELADVLCYALSLANVLDIDVSAAVREKLRKNAQKYPVERYRGRFRVP
jgi:dCTP diphosphatase